MEGKYKEKEMNDEKMKEIKLIFLKSKITFEDKNTQKSFIEQFKKQGNIPFLDQDKKQIGLTYMDEEGFLVSVMEDKEYHRTHDIKDPLENVSIGFTHKKPKITSIDHLAISLSGRELNRIEPEEWDYEKYKREFYKKDKKEDGK